MYHGGIVPLSFLLVKTLNLLLLGDAYARNLGLNIKRARLLVITCSGVLVAIVTAYCGPIIFLGLAVPHLCRGMFRTSDHRILMPASLLAGASLALVCNLIARMPGFEGALPVNSVTALVGAPVVMSVLFNKRRNEMNDACSRLAELVPEGLTVHRLVPLYKDWNEVLQHRAEIADGKYLREAIYGLKEPPQEETVEIIRMSEVDTQTVEWLWKPYIPFGKVTIVQGNPGEGKTTFALRLAAACTTGR